MGTPPHPHGSAGPPPAAAQIQTRKPRVGFISTDVPPTQFLYMQDNDFLSITAISNGVSTPSVTAKYRFLTPDNEIKEGTAVSGGGSFFQFTLGEGWLLSLAMQVPGQAAGVWTYVQVLLERQSFTVHQAQTDYQVIWEGYILAGAADGWPDTPSQRATDGAGTLRTVTGTAPGAGSDINEIVPTFRRWQLMSFVTVLTTSATVANRQVQFVLDDGSTTQHFHVGAAAAQVASTSIIYTLAPGLQSFTGVDGSVIIPGPTPLLLKPAWRIRTITTNIQAGDVWQQPRYVVSEWQLWDA